MARFRGIRGRIPETTVFKKRIPETTVFKNTCFSYARGVAKMKTLTLMQRGSRFLFCFLMQCHAQDIDFCNTSAVERSRTNRLISLGVSSNAKNCFPCSIRSFCLCFSWSIGSIFSKLMWPLRQHRSFLRGRGKVWLCSDPLRLQKIKCCRRNDSSVQLYKHKLLINLPWRPLLVILLLIIIIITYIVCYIQTVTYNQLTMRVGGFWHSVCIWIDLEHVQHTCSDVNYVQCANCCVVCVDCNFAGWVAPLNPYIWLHVVAIYICELLGAHQPAKWQPVHTMQQSVVPYDTDCFTTLTLQKQSSQ